MSTATSKFTAKMERARARVSSFAGGRTDPWTDLGLTLPIFLGYHLGVVFLPMRNAADFVTSSLTSLASASVLAYAGLTLALGAVLVGVLVVLGRGAKLRWRRFVSVIAEGAVYAVVMGWLASRVVGGLRLGGSSEHGFFSGLVMSLGAGFYEEVAFRVVLFGLGLRLLSAVLKTKSAWVVFGWALGTSFVFSAWHYVGAFGDAFGLGSFVFRWICGMVFVAIYRYRGFAPVVWCHALYDVWVLAL